MTNKAVPQADVMLEVRLNEAKSDEDSRQAYEAVYRDADISQSRSFYLWLIERLELRPHDIYLDISCGQAELLLLAQARGIQAHGMDLSHNALKLGRQQSEAANLATANSQQMPYASNCFTVITNIGSLEHYVDMATAVREMVRILKPGGRAYILLPNTFSLLTNIWIAFRQGRTSIDPYQPIQRYGARLEWQTLLENNGLTVDRTIKYERERPRTWEDFWYVLRHPKQLVRILLAPFIPLNLSFCFVFVCHKPVT